MNARRPQLGIGVFGLVTVMLIVGLVAGSLTPLMLTKHKRTTEDSDRAALEAAKNAIIGYTMQNGSLPTPDAATARCPVGVMPANLGVNNWGKHGRDNPFCFDSNTALRAMTTSKTLCAAARTQIASTPANTPYSNTTPVAFVLYSTGNDRISNQRNATATSTTRIFEPDNRGIDDSAGSNHYDDQVVSYPLSSLLTECAKLGGAPVCDLKPTTQTVYLSPTTATATLTASLSNISSNSVACSSVPCSPVTQQSCATPCITWTGTGQVTPVSLTGIGSTLTFGAVGTYNYSVQAMNEFGKCPAAFTAQVIVNNPLPSGNNLALGAAFTGSHAGGHLWKLQNGNPNNNGQGGNAGAYWNTSGATGWVVVNLGGTKAVNQVIVYSLQDYWSNPNPPNPIPDTLTFNSFGVADFTVQGWNGSTWVSIAPPITNNRLVKRVVVIDPAFSTSQIRVLLQRGYSSLIFLTEIEVWGS